MILIFYTLIKHDSKIMNQTQMTETLKYMVNKLVQKRAKQKKNLISVKGFRDKIPSSIKKILIALIEEYLAY